MRILRGSTLLAAGLALAWPAFLKAQSVPSPYRFIEPRQEANLFVGWFNPNRGQYGTGPGEGLVLGGRYGLELTGPLALEGVATFIPTDRDVVSPYRPEGDRVVAQAASKLLMVDARLRFTFTGRRTWRGISPYLMAGGGLMFDVEGAQREDLLLEEPDRFDMGVGFTGTFGAGLKWFLSEHWTVRSDGALMIYRLDVPDGFAAPQTGLENVPENEWVNATVLSIGLSRLF